MIRKHAMELLESTKLIGVLSGYGEVFITGSFRMDMMCWNDIDLYIEDSERVRDNWHELVSSVLHCLSPYRFDGFCKEGGMFLGCETGITGEKWNVDIWVRDSESIENSIRYCDEITRRTSERPELKSSILEIKQRLIALGMYGMDKDPARHYHSDEIYRSVLEENIRTAEEFMERHPK